MEGLLQQNIPLHFILHRAESEAIFTVAYVIERFYNQYHLVDENVLPTVPVLPVVVLPQLDLARGIVADVALVAAVAFREQDLRPVEDAQLMRHIVSETGIQCLQHRRIHLLPVDRQQRRDLRVTFLLQQSAYLAVVAFGVRGVYSDRNIRVPDSLVVQPHLI